jgi:hypothetical protein
VLPNYNRILKKSWTAPNTIANPSKYAGWTAADQKAIDKVVGAAKKLKARYEGMQVWRFPPDP